MQNGCNTRSHPFRIPASVPSQSSPTAILPMIMSRDLPVMPLFRLQSIGVKRPASGSDARTDQHSLAAADYAAKQCTAARRCRDVDQVSMPPIKARLSSRHPVSSARPMYFPIILLSRCVLRCSKNESNCKERKQHCKKREFLHISLLLLNCLGREADLLKGKALSPRSLQEPNSPLV
ncbi:MAG: hypothetical protein JFAIHJKO_02204 [Pyrinomonadaceae bacterium]|nr:hypothetical protein [Pyrinomonadaceae bacterium]